MSKLTASRFPEDLIICGYLRKLNTMKKKFFVLYKDTKKEGARLEYFDSMKKFKSGAPAKRIVQLETCLNINRRFDTKHAFVIALATKDGGLSIVLGSEDEMLKWLQALISIQRNTTNKYSCFPTFDHVWQVVLQKKSLAEEKNLVGNYHACLSSKSFTFVRIGPEKSLTGLTRATDVEIPLNTIRRCGDSHCLFYMEVGRQCTIGPGELWMETEDPLVAQNMHKTISSAMSIQTERFANNKRRRSLSVAESYKKTDGMKMDNINTDKSNFDVHEPANNTILQGSCKSSTARIHETKNHSESAHISASCSVVQGPLTLPRYKTSPPLSSQLRCTARKELSAVDDREESGNYLAFRFKSAEGPIPEENSDDLMNSDNTSCHREPYVSMSAVAKPLDSTEGNIPHSIGLDNVAFSSKCSLTYDGLIPRNPSVSIPASNELESEERPKRSYSIGSKIDKNKIKRFGNSNDGLQETNIVRVRAFSVGSRAKIPKCDLQRAFLFPKSYLNQSCISNNSLNFGVDDSGYILELNSKCNKKSTSAPILIHNGQVPKDCMSDLMEIDFSKSSNHKPQKTVYLKEKYYERSSSEFNSRTTSPLLRSLKREESGYLEMKPADRSIPFLTNLNECTMRMIKNKNISVDAKIFNKKSYTAIQNLNENEELNPINDNNEGNKFHLPAQRINMDSICSNYSKLSLRTSSKLNTNSNQIPSLTYAQKRNTQVINTQLGGENKNCNILQNKYDDLETETPMSKDQQVSSLLKNDNNPLRSDKFSLPVGVSLKESISAKHAFCNETSFPGPVSMSSSGSSNCFELHYAKLDLPQCRTKGNTKFQNVEDDITINNPEIDSYAKIDFDHSSDSSSASKLLIN